MAMAKLTLDWKDDNDGLTGFEVYKSTMPLYINSMQLAGSVSATTKHYEEDVVQDSAVYFRVKALSPNGDKGSDELAMAYPAKVMPLNKCNQVRADWPSSILAGAVLNGSAPSVNYTDGPAGSDMMMQTADGTILIFKSSGVYTFNPATNAVTLIDGSTPPTSSWSFLGGVQNSRGEILVLEGGGSRYLRKFDKASGAFTDLAAMGGSSFARMVLMDNDDIVFASGDSSGGYVAGTTVAGKWSDSTQVFSTFSIPTDSGQESEPSNGWLGQFDGRALWWPSNSRWAISIDPNGTDHHVGDFAVSYPSALSNRNGMPWRDGVFFVGGGTMYTVTALAGEAPSITTKALSAMGTPVAFTDNVSCARVLPTGDYLFLGADKALQLDASRDGGVVISGPAGGYGFLVMLGNQFAALSATLRWDLRWPVPFMLKLPNSYLAGESNRSIQRPGT
ncbi:hypothetical protein Ah13B_47 [Aeromonas phage AhMtk13b]|nr:hypothetical protein Ah13B_47 [Aeromonas phage AhMtk13b]